MSNPILISSVALIISVASFAFALFQFSRNQKLKKLEKINEIIAKTCDLRRSVQSLKYLVEATDDVDLHEDDFKKIIFFVECAFSVLNNPQIKATEIYSIEQSLLKSSLNFDLVSILVDEQIRLNKEWYDFKHKQNAS